MTAEPPRGARLPPRWFIRAFWLVHRGLYSVTGGRFGLRSATADRWGMLRLRAVGRRSGEPRSVILGYFEDGPNLVTMAMNGWARPEPAWWLNLKAQPDPLSTWPTGRAPSTHVRRTRTSGHACGPGWAEYDAKLDAYAALRARATEVVILEPSSAVLRSIW